MKLLNDADFAWVIVPAMLLTIFFCVLTYDTHTKAAEQDRRERIEREVREEIESGVGQAPSSKGPSGANRAGSQRRRSPTLAFRDSVSRCTLVTLDP
jgi:hypothetical protein